MSSKAVGNNPERVDKILGRIILTGYGVTLGWVWVTNLTPYSQFAYNFLFGARRAGVLMDLPFIGGLITEWGVTIATVAAALLFSAVQAGEIWGVWLCLTQRHRVTRQQLIAAMILALVCFGIDLVAVFNFFPPINVPFAQFAAAGAWSQIRWTDLGIGSVILFGGVLYVALWQLVRRLA
ncbi:MAG TPA: hypothetical protein V6D29_01385 [Leptolyngbyaceae cyanobacterium]